MEPLYTEEAIKDLKQRREFIGKQNPIAAERIAKELIKKVNMLTDFPNIGTAVQYAPSHETLRDMVFDNYIVRNSIHSKTIIILHI